MLSYLYASVGHVMRPIYKAYEYRLDRQIKGDLMPQHIAIILDGNRRFAYDNGLMTKEGHIRGGKKAEEVLRWCLEDLNINTVTVYGWSMSNFERPESQVSETMQVIEERLRSLKDDPLLNTYGVRVKIIGNREVLNDNIRSLVEDVESKTEKYNMHNLNIALAYDGQDEIARAFNKMIENGVTHATPETIEKHLDTAHQPQPDLIIRTSGEKRLSGFLLWQSAYSELVFTDVYWPEFRKIDMMRAIRTYQKRHRRHGK
ncbi:di-trans,poly-cis-decaprenylcistransferase [archaeon]|nr:MAG: di-trans,poly-cis-decaprenylcistransferase [archaeon]